MPPTRRKRKAASKGVDKETDAVAANNVDDIVPVGEEDREIVEAIERIAARSDKCEAALRRGLEQQGKSRASNGLSCNEVCDATILAARELHSAVDAVDATSSNGDGDSRGDSNGDADVDGVNGCRDDISGIADELRQAHLGSLSHVFDTDVDAVRHEAGFGTSVRDVESLASVLALGADVTSSSIEAQLFMEMVEDTLEEQGSSDTANDAPQQQATDGGSGGTSSDSDGGSGSSSSSSSSSGSGSGSDSSGDGDASSKGDEMDESNG